MFSVDLAQQDEDTAEMQMLLSAKHPEMRYVPASLQRYSKLLQGQRFVVWRQFRLR